MTRKYMIMIISLLFSAALIGGIIWSLHEESKPENVILPAQNNANTTKANMKIDNLVFKNNEYIPAKFTCDGTNVNPSLRISDVPAEAQSLALVMDDPDAPAGTWIHWVIWNIDPKIGEIGENSVPAGAVQGITSFGDAKYGGPCPPSGTHRYVFKLYALDTTLNIPVSTTASELENAMQGHVIAQTEMVGLYGR